MMRMTKSVIAAAAIAASASSYSTNANAGLDPYIGELMLVGFNFCPRGWTPAEGQLLAISSNTALFSLFGTIYGGDGRTTFALPDLRGRVPLSQGNGPGLSNVAIGQKGGVESVVMSQNQMPAHTHTATAVSTLHGTAQTADQALASDNILASASALGGTPLYRNPPADVTLDDGSVTTTVTVNNSGGSQAMPIRNPYVGMQWCVSMQGSYPSRN